MKVTELKSSSGHWSVNSRMQKFINSMDMCKLHVTLNAPITTKVVCFSRLLKSLRSLYGKFVDPDQTAPIGAVCSGSTLFASILNLSVMLGNYLQQTTFSDAFFSWRFKG